MIWAGVHEEDPEARALPRLVKVVGNALRPFGFKPEARRFHAHVTLARVRGRPSEAVLGALTAASEVELAAEVLSELKLILSDPSHRPYHYIDLTTVDLGG